MKVVDGSEGERMCETSWVITPASWVITPEGSSCVSVERGFEADGAGEGVGGE